MDIVGLVLFCTGLLVEAVADQQKFLFRNNPENKGKWCDKGWFLNPLLVMPILGFSNSVANKDMMSKIWTNGDTII